MSDPIRSLLACLLAAFVAGCGGDEPLGFQAGPLGAVEVGPAYDATTLLLSAIESIAIEEGGRLHMDRAALREEIGATSGFLGIIGKLSCDEFGDCGTGRVNIYFHADSSITDVAQLPVVYRYAP